MISLNSINMKLAPDLKDVYFIFADDVFSKKITYEKFKNLIKFYTLLYDRIIIPDSFLINNRNLHRFFLEEDSGFNYLKTGIITLTMRSEIDNIQDLLYSYKTTKTLNDDIKDEEIKEILYNYDFKRTLKWKLQDVSLNFSKHILSTQDTIPLNSEDIQIWKDVVLNLNEKNKLTRQEIYNNALKLFEKDSCTLDKIVQHADIVYNFNLPSIFNISSAYPERLLSNEVLSPEKVFFPIQNQNNDKIQPEDLFSEETLTLDEPLIFYSEILRQLKFENILAIRGTQEFKSYMKSIKCNDSMVMQNAFFEYCMMCNQLIPNMISVNHEEIKKLKTKINISQKVENTVGEISSLVIGMVPLGNIASIPVEYLISKGIEITGKTLSNKIATEYGIKSIEAKRSTKKAIIDNPKTVLDEMNEVFQINKLK